MVRLALHHQDRVGEDQVLFGWAGDKRFSAGDNRPGAVGGAVKTMGLMQVLVTRIIVLGVELPAKPCREAEAMQVERGILHLAAGIGISEDAGRGKRDHCCPGIIQSRIHRVGIGEERLADTKYILDLAYASGDIAGGVVYYEISVESRIVVGKDEMLAVRECV